MHSHPAGSLWVEPLVMWANSNQKTLAHAARMAAAGISPTEAPAIGSPQECAPSWDSQLTSAKRSARNIPTGPRAKRERRSLQLCFGLVSRSLHAQ